jgi:predicted nucleotide-binding protein (sugar kinase/HSP70/actin superfamily)
MDAGRGLSRPAGTAGGDGATAKLTFPHLGTLYVSVETLLLELGAEVVVPPPCTQRTLELGTRLAPEGACLPLKLGLGNFLEGREQGAEAVVMAGGSGPCRFGYYAQVQREILRAAGCELEMIVLEPPQGHLRELLAELRRWIPGFTLPRFWRAFQLAWAKIVGVDEVERSLLAARASEAEAGQADALFARFLARCRQVDSPRRVNALVAETLGDLKGLPRRPGPVLQVGVVGEIYTVLEPFANLYTERRLGRLGVQVVRRLFLGDWIREHLFRFRVKQERRRLAALAAPHLNHFVGGHGLETVAHSVEFAREGVAGVVQIAPLTCMPEIVAETVLPEVSEAYGLPVLTLFVDEHTAEAGLQTRLEAFVDLLAQRTGAGRVDGPLQRMLR